MLSTNDAFDREVKRKLDELRSEEIPMDFLEDLNSRLDAYEKKKKRKVFFWFFMATVFAAITFSSIQLFKSNPILKRDKTPLSNPQQATVVPSKSLKQSSKTIQKNSKNQLTYDEKIIALPKKTTYQISQKQVSQKRKVERKPIGRSLKKMTPSVDQFELSIPQSFTNDTHEIITFPMIPEIAPLRNDLSVKMVPISSNPVYLEPGILPIEKEKWIQSFGFFTGMSGIRSSVNAVDLTGVSWSNPPLVSEKYLAIRNAQERSTSSIDLSLRTSWSKHHFLIQTGLDYFEWGEQLKYDYNLVFDGVNRYSYVSVPLYLGYCHSWNKVGLSASVGSSIGCAIKQDGYYIQPNLTTIAVEHASDWTTTGYFQVELSYLIDRYRFSLAPTYRKSLSHVINFSETFNVYDSFGLQMGITVILK